MKTIKTTTDRIVRAELDDDQVFRFERYQGPMAVTVLVLRIYSSGRGAGGLDVEGFRYKKDGSIGKQPTSTGVWGDDERAQLPEPVQQWIADTRQQFADLLANEGT